MPSDAPEIETESAAETPQTRAGRVRLLTLDSLDGRTAAAQRARGLVAGLEADLGGAEHLSVAQRQLAQRAAVLGAWIEDAEARWLAGRPVDVAEHLAAINAQRRVLATLGLDRVARDVTPPLRDYIRQRAEAAE